MAKKRTYQASAHPREHTGAFSRKTWEKVGRAAGGLGLLLGGGYAGVKYGGKIGRKAGDLAGRLMAGKNPVSRILMGQKYEQIGSKIGQEYAPYALAVLGGNAGYFGGGWGGRKIDDWGRRRRARKAGKPDWGVKKMDLIREAEALEKLADSLEKRRRRKKRNYQMIDGEKVPVIDVSQIRAALAEEPPEYKGTGPKQYRRQYFTKPAIRGGIGGALAGAGLGALDHGGAGWKGRAIRALIGGAAGGAIGAAGYGGASYLGHEMSRRRKGWSKGNYYDLRENVRPKSPNSYGFFEDISRMGKSAPKPPVDPNRLAKQMRAYADYLDTLSGQDRSTELVKFQMALAKSQQTGEPLEKILPGLAALAGRALAWGAPKLAGLGSRLMGSAVGRAATRGIGRAMSSGIGQAARRGAMRGIGAAKPGLALGRKGLSSGLQLGRKYGAGLKSSMPKGFRNRRLGRIINPRAWRAGDWAGVAGLGLTPFMGGGNNE